MHWYFFVNGFVIGALIVDDIILRWKLKKTVKLMASFQMRGLEEIGEIRESPSDLAYLKERGFI
jgi:hypothetical protein